MIAWRELVDPRKLASSLEVSLKFKRAILIYLLATLSAICSALYYGLFKIKIEFFMPILRTFTAPYTSVWDIIFGRIIYVVFGMLLILLILRVTLIFVKSGEIKSYPLISIVFHSSLAIIMISLIFSISAFNSPFTEVNIVSATLRDVKLSNAELAGKYLSNLSSVEIYAEKINADQLIAMAVFMNGTSPDWSEIYQRGMTIDLSELTEYITIKSAAAYIDDKILNLGDVEVKSLKWRTIEFSTFSDMIYYPIPPLNFMAGLFSLLSWIWIIGYSVIATKHYYSLSTTTTIVVSIITFIVLFIFGFV